MARKRYLIIGDGAAGTTAAQYIRRGDPAGAVEIISDDPHPAYFRAALTNYLIGELREEQIWAVPPTFYRENRIKRTLGRVVAVDTKRAHLHLSRGGAPETYDYLVVAAGSAARQPPFPGGDLPGVMVMRTLQDVRGVMDLIKLRGLQRAVIVGGGPLALEWVQGLHERGVPVTYLLRKRRLMGRLLDPTASDLALARLRLAGVDVRLEEEVAEAVPGADGRVRSVLTKSGELIDCGLVGVAIGVECNVAFLAGSGLARGRRQALAVDDRLQTNIPNIFAAGDIADVSGFLPQLWEPARRQARVAAANITGGDARYDPGAHYNATRLYDLDLAAVGQTLDGDNTEALLDFPRGEGRIAYRKLLLRDGRLVGALLLGQRSEQVRARGRLYKRLIDNRVDVTSLAENGRGLPPLLDLAFDLAAWLDRRDLLARPAPPQPAVAAPAQLRQTGLWRRDQLPKTTPDAPRPPDRPAGALRRATGERHPLAATLTLGRGEDNDIVLDDRQVSAKHAIVRWQGDRYFVNDLASSNGTYHNGVRLKRPVPLSDGDRLRLGQTALTVVLAAENGARLDSVGLQTRQLRWPSLPPVAAAVTAHVTLGARRHPLATAVTSFGRDPENDIVVDDPAVSHLHAQISRHGDDFYLRDVGSRNGTWLGDQPVITPHRLSDGEIITLGRARLTFHSGGPAAESNTPVAVAGPQPDRLAIRSGNQLGLTFALEGDRLRLGRDPLSDIHLDSPTISWRHATLAAVDDHWTLRDAGSRNGTRVNDQPLAPESPLPLTDGDIITLGNVAVQFLAGRQTSPPPAVVPALRSQPARRRAGRRQESSPAAAPHDPRPTRLQPECANCGREVPPEAHFCPHCNEAIAVAPATGPAPATLVYLDDGARYSLLGFILLGRDADCDIVLMDMTVSGHHAEIVSDAAGLRIRDLGSRNGTFLNGRRLTIHFEPLAPGDIITLGETIQLNVKGATDE